MTNPSLRESRRAVVRLSDLRRVIVSHGALVLDGASDFLCFVEGGRPAIEAGRTA